MVFSGKGTAMSSHKLNRILAFVIAGVLVGAALMVAGCSQGSSSSSSSSKSSSSASASAASSSSASASGSSSSKSSSSTTSTTTGSYTSKVESGDPYGTGTHHAVVTVEGYEPFTIELYADEAPVTVSNFCKLANDGFYDGLTFYRFVDGFCMQGGSSNNSAAAANDGLTPIVGEFASNGVENSLADSFAKGVVAMARNSNPNSATSTFFVTLGSGSSVSASLDGQYAAFGLIEEAGMQTVDKIVADYLPKVTDASMGAIGNEANQARITSIEITD